MKKLIKMMLALITLVFAISCGSNEIITCPNFDEIGYSEPWDGITVEEIIPDNGIYIITEARHLAWLATQPTIAMDIRFDTNIDMDSKAFSGIKNFAGKMDGNGKKIKNLTINNTADDSSDAAGLICVLDNGTVKNLIIESGNIKGKNFTGAFVGKSTGSSTITGVTNKAAVESIASFGSAGGIIGEATGVETTINNAVNSGDITIAPPIFSGTDAGGIIGIARNNIVKINNAVNSGNVTATGTFGGDAGGIIGDTDTATITINNAVNSGDITAAGGYASAFAGGIIGNVNTSTTITINNVGNSGVITAISTTSTTAVGGIIGNASGTTTIDFAYNYIKDVKMVGDSASATIIYSYSLADTTATGTLSAPDFKKQGSFEGWDFDGTWEIVNGMYPTLQAFK